MKRTFAVLILLCLGVVAFGQTKTEGPNFTGTWKREDLASAIKYSYPFGVKCEPPLLDVAHTDSELKISSTLNCHRIDKGAYKVQGTKSYYTDGRGEFNDLTGASTTRWDRKKIVTVFKALKNGKDTEWLQIYEISKKLDKITVRIGVKGDPIETFMAETYRKQFKF